jgi:hypothetical protein
VRERLDPPFIAPPPSQRIVTMRLVIVGAIVIIVPILTSFTCNTVSLLALVSNLAVCISLAYYVTQVSFIPIPAMVFGGCDVDGGDPTQTLAVVDTLTPSPVRAI